MATSRDRTTTLKFTPKELQVVYDAFTAWDDIAKEDVMEFESRPPEYLRHYQSAERKILTAYEKASPDFKHLIPMPD